MALIGIVTFRNHARFIHGALTVYPSIMTAICFWRKRSGYKSLVGWIINVAQLRFMDNVMVAPSIPL
jgi:hypothetical protein